MIIPVIINLSWLLLLIVVCSGSAAYVFFSVARPFNISFCVSSCAILSACNVIWYAGMTINGMHCSI